MTDPSDLPTFSPSPDQNPLRARVLGALHDAGLAPRLDDDGDVAYQANEQTLFVRVTEGEVAVMRVFGQWTLPDEIGPDDAKISQTCNEVNLSLNCVKTGFANNTLVATSEHIVLDGMPVGQLLQISTQVILSAVQLWHERALGVEPGDDPDQFPQSPAAHRAGPDDSGS